MSPLNKRKVKNPVFPTDNQGKAYWTRLDEVADTKEFREFVEREIPNHAVEMLDSDSRRKFLKLMAASFALAGVSGCYPSWPWWPTEAIAPYAYRPEGMTPGIPQYFATSVEIGGIASGLLVKSYDFRPIKIEGNPSHPISKGSTTAIQQGLVLEEYDPDRSQEIYQKQDGQIFTRNWDEFVEYAEEHFSLLKQQSGKGLAVLSEPTSSPTVNRLKQEFINNFPQSKWYEYEPINNDNERSGTKLAFGKPMRPLPQLNSAKIILSLDADILGTHPASQKLSKDFIEGRNPSLEHDINRFYLVESTYTNTGSKADHRLPLPATQVLPFTVQLIREILNQRDFEAPSQFAGLSELSVGTSEDIPQEYISALAEDLIENKGQSVIIAGAKQPSEVHALAGILNGLLDNIGKTIQYTELEDQPSHIESITQLTNSIQNGDVDTLVILGGNPAFDAPADLEFGNYLKIVPNTIQLSLYKNETTEYCTWHVNRAHFLESWGDGRAYDGTICTTQPLIYPLYNGKTIAEFLTVINGNTQPNPYEIMRETFRSILTDGDFEEQWKKLLYTGVAENSAFQASNPSFRTTEVTQAVQAKLDDIQIPTIQNIELSFLQDTRLYDGRFANNGWLQETPDFVTKVCWDNPLLVSPKTANMLDVNQNDLVTLNLNGNSLTVPVYVLPGQPNNSLAIALGGGREKAGQVGNGVGFNTYSLRTSNNFNFGVGVTIEKTGEKYELAETQEHHMVDFYDEVGANEVQLRLKKLVKEATIEEYLANPDFVHKYDHHPPLESLWEEWDYSNVNKWGMAIDLNACTGCMACVVACQAENNVPVVGKEEVIRGREMHWLRIDRYFKGEVEDPGIVQQPMMCVHCENAPCESVCPVNATVHSEEGLNLMVYNRCIGTRYCSNNCPFKIRRFNYFYYHKDLNPTTKMQHNPEVTVRTRGVMEKCTYCVQRIEKVKIKAKNERRPIEDGEIVTACQQSCPTQAIVFGDLNKKDSKVAQLHEKSYAYYLLEYLNIKPRTAYLAKITNPNHKLVKKTVDEYDSHH